MSKNKDDPFAILETAVARQSSVESAGKHLSTCRAKLILGRDAKSAFFATLALRLKLEVDWSCETMATDGRVLTYHPEFVTGLSPDELMGVLVHEVMHNALAHPFRRGSRDSQQWNIACDLAVNPLLVDAEFVLPSTRLMPGEGTYAHLPWGKSAEEYYALLEESRSEEPEEPGDSESLGEGTDPGGCGGVSDPAPGSPGETEQIAAEWQVAVVQAEQIAKGRGELPGGLSRVVEAIQHPPQNWREVLRAFVSAQARNDYSWSRPNRRFLWQGLYLPGLHSEELGEVVIAIDTSGSVGTKELGIFAEEVNGILGAFDCSATVLYHDTEVRHTQSWRTSDGPLVLDPVGGGGTSHRCIFDWLDRSDVVPSCLICLSDLETEFPDQAPALPVLWAVVGDNTTVPPFGYRITIGG